MKSLRFTIFAVIGAFAIVSLGNGAAIAQSSSRTNLSYYMTSKENRLALEAAEAMAAQSCKSSVTISANKPDKFGGMVMFLCGAGRSAISIGYKRIPGGRLVPDKFYYPG